MASASPARTTALHLLGAQRRRHARARDLMRGAREMEALGRKGRALATRLVLGVNVASGELDRRIDSFSSRPGSIEPRVRDALRLAAFEVLYLDTPCQVAVSQGVELVRGVQPRAARMANAVLRRIADCRPEVDAARAAVAAYASAACGDDVAADVDEVGVGCSAFAATGDAIAPGSAGVDEAAGADEARKAFAGDSSDVCEPGGSAGVGCSTPAAAEATIASGSAAEKEIAGGLSESATSGAVGSVARAPEPSTEELCLASGYPAWLVERLLGSLGAERVAAMCACALEPAPVYVCAGKPEVDADGAKALLEGAHLAPQASELGGCWRLEAAAGLARSGLVANCDVVVADLAAQLACRVAAAPGRVLEVGQGRGTKSLMLARLGRELGGEPVVVGCELVSSKVRLSASRMEQASLSETVSCVEFDGTKLANEEELPVELAGAFDSVLVDAPCSGTGTMRRHPETAWALEEELVGSGDEGLPSLQLCLLSAASARVAVGGQLVYATCSVLETENAEVVDAFLASEAGRGYERASLLEAPAVECCETAKSLIADNLTPAGDFQSVPRARSFDGHFFARLVRKA